MKKILYLIPILGLFITFNVNAAGPEVKLSCPEIVTTSSAKCTLSASNTNSKEYTVENFKISVSGPVNATEYVNDTTTDGEFATISFKPTASTGSIKFKTEVSLKNAEENFDKSYEKEATIAIVSSDNTLKSITINDKTITIANKNLTEYKAEVKGKTADVKAEASDSSATITGVGNKNLACGDNKITISVKASNGSSKDYNLTIKRICEENVLKEIKLSTGVLSPAFNKNTYDYTVTLSKEIDKITIKGTKNFDAQKLAGEVENAALQIGSNNFNLIVTDEENKEQKYNITVIRDESLSSKAYLTSMTLSSGKINFDQNTFNYKTRVLYEVTKLNIMATPLEEGAKVTATGATDLKVGENTVLVTVTTKNNEKNTYTILVNRLKQGESIGDNPNIKNITISGYDLNFDYDKTDYKLLINDENELNITVEMEDELATYQIVGNHDLKDKSVIQIITKSTDELQNKTYNIEISKPHSNKIFYIIGAILLALLLAGIILAYYLVNKKKKEKNIDVNGVEIENKEPTNPVLASSEIVNTEVNQNNNETKCPYCQRDLLITNEICPYCGNKIF